MEGKPEFRRRSASEETGLSKKPASASDNMLALSVVAALVLILLVTFLPRPAFRVDRVEYGTTACDPASHSYQVTASMTIRNVGGVGGVASVHLLVDGHIAATGNYEIPAHESIVRGLNGIVADCQWHRFSVELFVPPSDG